MTDVVVQRARETLTRKEAIVLARILLGETNKEIAMALSCSVKTIEFHISNILKKTGFGSRLRLAVEFGELRPRSE